MDLRALEEELKKLGISIVSSQQDTVVSIRIKGLAGKALVQGLKLCDQLLHEKVKTVLKTCVDPTTKLFADPTFGPSGADPQGASALCKQGTTIPSKGGSPHQLKVLGLLKNEKIRWERPEYAPDDADDRAQANNQEEDDNQDDDDDGPERAYSDEKVFARDARLFADGVSSGDVIQGNLGDCWFLSALSVVATRSDLLEQTFWRGDRHKGNGLFVCKFMKNFVWHYVLIDDRVPVYGFSKTREGKPYFARCRDPNELWVCLLEKAYAKLHGSYEALIGGFIDVALNDLTGMCSEQVIMKAGFPGFHEDPFAPAKPHQRKGDPFWEKLQLYKNSGTLMGCSIQPVPSPSDAAVAAESSAGNGLYYKHAYALVDAAEIKTVKNESVRLVKLRNPWGMGEWSGPWSDASEERNANHDVIEQYFKILKRKVGGNATKRVFLSLNGKGDVQVDEIAQEEVIEVNANDGTFFMSFDAWMDSFTHFFAGIDFPDAWHGRRVEGSWNDANCGGNTTKSTWINNPRFELVLEERSHVFISLSQEDPRGKENLKIVPIGFHICSLTPLGGDDKSGKYEIKEPAGKSDSYYRLYKEKDRIEYKKNVRAEPLPPAIIPGSVLPGVDEDGVPQPAYTFKQAVSVDVTMEAGRYCIIPSMYMRTNKDTGKTNVGTFWVSVYSDKGTFRLEGGEKIAEEEEGGDDESGTTNNQPASPAHSQKQASLRMATTTTPSLHSPGKKSDTSVSGEALSVMDRRRRFEDFKDELLARAKAIGIGLGELKKEFLKATSIKKVDLRRKMIALGFKPDELSEDKISVLVSGLEEEGDKTGLVSADRIVNMFEAEIQEDHMACAIPEIEDDDVPQKLHQEGVLSIELRGAKDLALKLPKGRSLSTRKVHLPLIEFSTTEKARRRQAALTVCAQNPALAAAIRPLLKRNGWLPAIATNSGKQGRTALATTMVNPVGTFYELLEKEYKTLQEPTSDPTQVSNESLTVEPLTKLTTSSIGGSTTASVTTASRVVALHKSERMRNLELKRTERLALLQKRKQQALGDHVKQAELPRLIGGRKSGSNHVQCIDCGARVQVPGRNTTATATLTTTAGPQTATSFTCHGSRCMNTLCAACFVMLPDKKKLCESCFEHELMPTEVFGAQLRSILIEKIGSTASDPTQCAARLDGVFRELDKDGSGALSRHEFVLALEQFGIEPRLTQDQVESLLAQFDANKDGEISLNEFKEWLLNDQVWQPSTSPMASLGDDGSSTNKVTPEIQASVILPVLSVVLDAAFASVMVSHATTQWVSTRNTTRPRSVQSTILSDAGRNERKETGAILFQRVMGLRMSGDPTESGSATSDSAVEQIFQRFDTDGSGKIDQSEFMELLSALGMNVTTSEARLLMHRLEMTTPEVNGVVELDEFRAYVAKMTTQRDAQRSSGQQAIGLVDKLLEMDRVVSGDAAKREQLQDLLQQLHWSMRIAELRDLQHALRRQCGLSITLDELQRLANVCHFREVVPTPSHQQTAKPMDTTDDKLLELNNSGDVLNCVLFSAPNAVGSVMLKTFDLARICRQVTVHVEALTKTSSIESTWTSLFGVTPELAIDQRDFLDKLLQSGLSLATGSDDTNSTTGPSILRRLSTKFQLAMALDALRWETSSDTSTGDVTIALFTMMLRRDKVDEIEQRFARALSSFLRFCQGEQSFLVHVAVDDNARLIVRATEPVLKYEMDFVLDRDEYTIATIHQLSATIWSTRQPRPAISSSSGTALLTRESYPFLHDAIRLLLSRLRVSSTESITTQHGMTPFLTLVEADAFVQTLRDMLARAGLPFFWCVSPTALTFSIDGDFLAQKKCPSFQQLVVETLTRKRSTTNGAALLSLLKFTGSSLTVHYEVIGQNTVFTSTWSDFQALLSGQQDTFAVLELKPQGDLFTTRVDRTGGNGAPSWQFTQAIVMKEPERSEHRIDRPVVYTDTVKVSSIPDGSSTKTITFSVMDSKETSKTGTHFMVLTVRRALPETTVQGPQAAKPRLYCTAYDPFTSCDYAVDGCPSQWDVDYFNPSVHNDFEAKWQREILPTLSLGTTLTPKVLVKVYTKRAKAETLVGECEISVSSAIAHEGYLFDDWFPLVDPSNASKSAGAVSMAFQFHAKKTSEDASQAVTPLSKTVSVKANSTVKAKEEMPRPAATTTTPSGSSETRLRELEKSLQETEAAKREALEQAKRLQVLLAQQAGASGAAVNESSEVLRWKKKMEQVRREQEAQQQEQEARFAALQAELRRLEEHRESAGAPSPPAAVRAPITNLKQAALSDDASAHDLLSAMKDILLHRSPDRPYNGLKKALAAVAELPGKVSPAAFDDVLSDFGLGLTMAQRTTLLSILDTDHTKNLLAIEDFFIKLCGDAEMYASVPQVGRSSVRTPRESVALPTARPKPTPPEPRPDSAPSSPTRANATMPAPTRPQKMSWKEMKKLLVLNLPDGWEVRFTEKGRPYFCHHANRSTQWKHPIPEVDAKYSEWVKENGANFQRMAATTTVAAASTSRK